MSNCFKDWYDYDLGKRCGKCKVVYLKKIPQKK